MKIFIFEWRDFASGFVRERHVPLKRTYFQVILEKLLRDCPDVKRVYLLARGRKGVPPVDRINELLNNSVCPFVEAHRHDV